MFNLRFMCIFIRVFCPDDFNGFLMADWGEKLVFIVSLLLCAQDGWSFQHKHNATRAQHNRRNVNQSQFIIYSPFTPFITGLKKKVEVPFKKNELLLQRACA